MPWQQGGLWMYHFEYLFYIDLERCSCITFGWVAASVRKTGDGGFLFFAIGISLLIRQSGFLIRH